MEHQMTIFCPVFLYERAGFCTKNSKYFCHNDWPSIYNCEVENVESANQWKCGNPTTKGYFFFVTEEILFTASRRAPEFKEALPEKNGYFVWIFPGGRGWRMIDAEDLFIPEDRSFEAIDYNFPLWNFQFHVRSQKISIF